MKTISIKLPDDVANQMQEFVKAGYFSTEHELVLAALAQFIRRNRIELAEEFARDDIAWAKREAKKAL